MFKYAIFVDKTMIRTDLKRVFISTQQEITSPCNTLGPVQALSFELSEKKKQQHNILALF
jgi:hypothetical protein